MADRFWVGGTGTWDASSTARWSTTSGGAGGASVPTATDNVFFDGASAAGNYTVTPSGGSIRCANLNIAKATAGTLTFAGTAFIEVYGNLNTVGAGVSWTSTAALRFLGTGSFTVTTGGVTFVTFLFSLAGSTWTLQDTVNLSVSIQVNAGTLNLNDQIVNTTTFNGAGPAILQFGTSGVMNLSLASGTVWNGAAGITTTGNTQVNITATNGVATRTVSPNTMTEANAINFNITGGTDTVTITGATRDLNFTGFSGTLSPSTRTVYGNLTYSPTMTVTASSGVTTTLAATSGTKIITTNGISVVNSFNINGGAGSGATIQLADDLNTWNGSAGTGFTLTVGTLDLNNRTLTTGIFTTNGASVRSIAFGTSGVINIAFSNATVWNAQNATNFTYTGVGVINLTANASVGNRNIPHGSSGGTFPTNLPPQFNIISGTDGIGTINNSSFNNINFSGFSGNLVNSTRNIYGNMVFSPTMIALGGANATTFAGAVDNQTIVNNGLLMDFPVTIFKTGGNLVLSEPLRLGSARTLTVNGGNLIANGHNITAGTFSSSNLNSRVIDISNTTVELQNIGTVWNMSASGNATVIANNSNINFTNNTTGVRVFAGGSLTYGTLNIGGDTSVSTTSFTGNNTFAGSITSTKTVPHTVSFTAGTTTTVGGFDISGTAGNVVNITSLTTAQHNLVLTGGGTVNVSYANISYSNASPATNTWYSLTSNNNIDSGNNTGWIFTAAPPAGNSSNFFLVF